MEVIITYSACGCSYKIPIECLNAAVAMIVKWDSNALRGILSYEEILTYKV